MAALALELNDAGLLVLREGRPRPEPESPAVALFEGGEFLLGRPAAARALLRPRAVHDRYFDPLDGEPLGPPFPPGLRRADLAHAHLLTLAPDPPPTEVFLAVPGFWSAEQLGLLLGVAHAAGLPVAGLVDAAVAACSFAGGEGSSLHVDLSRHRGVVTALTGGKEVARVRVAEAEGLGLHAFEERVAREVARRFVIETRFDPLHSGASEQALHDALPAWLFELRREATMSAVLAAGGREHRLELARADLVAALGELHRALAEEVAALRDGATRLLVSARLSRLPGAVEHLRAATGLPTLELTPDAAVSAILRSRDLLRHPGPALPFVTLLPTLDAMASAPRKPSGREGARPTHLLNAGVAHALGEVELALGTAPPLGVRGLGLRREGVEAHHCSILPEGDEVFLLDHAPGRTFLNGEVVRGRTALRAGDRLRLGQPGVELLLVSIAPEAPA
jgi:hypothetical protein